LRSKADDDADRRCDREPDAPCRYNERYEASGYGVVRAYSVRQALDLLDERKEVNLVLSDIRMPDVDGFDFLRVLRHRFPTLPIVLITGLPLTDDDVIPAGAVILEKPFAIEKLERVIAERLERGGSGTA